MKSVLRLMQQDMDRLNVRQSHPRQLPLEDVQTEEPFFASRRVSRLSQEWLSAVERQTSIALFRGEQEYRIPGTSLLVDGFQILPISGSYNLNNRLTLSRLSVIMGLLHRDVTTPLRT